VLRSISHFCPDVLVKRTVILRSFKDPSLNALVKRRPTLSLDSPLPLPHLLKKFAAPLQQLLPRQDPDASPLQPAGEEVLLALAAGDALLELGPLPVAPGLRQRDGLPAETLSPSLNQV
jgi:hypothetical protein